MPKGIDAMTGTPWARVRGRRTPYGPRRAGTAFLAGLWAVRGLRGWLALILLSGALALPALPVHADATDALFEAAVVGTASEVKAALSAGADPGARDERIGGTPLHWAAGFNSNPSVIKALIEGGADPGARDEVGATPLHAAASFNSNPSVIAALIEGGANPGARAENGVTALHATVRNNPSVIKALIEGGANPGARDNIGETPLHYAAQHSINPSVIAALIEGGADPGARDDVGATPLHWAAANDANPSVIEALIEGGANAGARDDGRSMTIWGGTTLRWGASVAGPGATPLHWAAANDANPSVIEALIEGGADPDARNERGRTPLHAAAAFGSNPSVITALIEAGAEPAARDDAGMVPFDYVKDNEALKETEAYWLLNDGRFE